MEVTAKHNEPPLSDRLAIDHETLTERVADLLTLARETIRQKSQPTMKTVKSAML